MVITRGAPSGEISEAKRVRDLPELLRVQELECEKSFYNEKVPELSEEFADTIRF